jgi:hypothetical protein
MHSRTYRGGGVEGVFLLGSGIDTPAPAPFLMPSLHYVRATMTMFPVLLQLLTVAATAFALVRRSTCVRIAAVPVAVP